MIFLKRLVEKKKKPLRPTDQNPFQVSSNIITKYVVLSGQQKGMFTAVGQFKIKFQISLYLRSLRRKWDHLNGSHTIRTMFVIVPLLQKSVTIA